MDTFIGTKSKMTQTWSSGGERLPVTIVKAAPLKVTRVKTDKVDGYAAILVNLGPRFTRELKVTGDLTQKPGDLIRCEDILHPGDTCAVTGVTKGRGFSGVMKRWGFKGGPKTHGQSDRARAPGAIGQGTSPGRIHKGKKMAGHYGQQTQTVKNIEVVSLDSEHQEIWLKGPVPGAINSPITIRVIHSQVKPEVKASL
jgi:large subunit ribosomal protein L3